MGGFFLESCLQKKDQKKLFAKQTAEGGITERKRVSSALRLC
jgi:hypothetical protein